MSTALLATKFHLPIPRQDTVPRPHLLTMLNASLQVKLTLVSAPAGFGKSTLVANWLTQYPCHGAWLSLDARDNDPIRFWNYVIAALQTIDAAYGSEAREILNTSGLHNLEPVVISLLNDLSQQTDAIVLVLDDYHVLDEQSIHESLQLLLEHHPPALHLILLTRADPPLPVARLRARRQLVEIRANTLQFLHNETTSLLNEVMQLDLTPAQIDALIQRTEGWITGLQLAGLSLQGQADPAAFIHEFTGSHQYILDYLTEEVLHTLPESHRQFLMQTAVLDRLCDGLCQAVTQNPRSHAIFTDIRSQNLFLIALDTSGQWFRYHHLFAEILYTMLLYEAGNSIPILHLRAADWYESQGYFEEAVTHTLQSGDMIQAKQRIVQHWATMVHQGHVGTALHWLDDLPDAFNHGDPAILLARCWVLHLSGRTPAIAPYLEQLEALAENLHGDNLIISQIAMMRSVLARTQGDAKASLEYGERAVAVVPPTLLHAAGPAWNLLAAARMNAGDIDGAIAAFEHGIELAYAGENLLSAFVSTFGLSAYLTVQGRLHEAEEVCRAALVRVTDDNLDAVPAVGLLHIALARIAVERNQLDESEALLTTGRHIARPGGFSEALRYGRYVQAQIAAARGHFDTANRLFMEAEPIIQAMADPYLTGELHREWLTVLLLADEYPLAQTKLRVLQTKSAATQSPSLELARGWITARLLIEEGTYQDALSTLDALIQRVRQANSQGELIRLLALRAVVLSCLYRQAKACNALQEALQLGEAQGYLRRWLDAGANLIPLLQAAKNSGMLSDSESAYLNPILAICQATFGKVEYSPNDALLSPLSERELELLKLIDAGYSNQQIAEELVITLHTVKKHTSNIYSKLGVSRRTQAIALARDYGLL